MKRVTNQLVATTRMLAVPGAQQWGAFALGCGFVCRARFCTRRQRSRTDG